jgi:ketosteroid isomerase-like protein
MSLENVEIVRAAIDGFNRRDWDSALKDVAPELQVDNSRTARPKPGVYGLDQVRAYWDEVTNIWESWRIEPHELIESGEHVVVPWTFHAQGRDGLEVEARVTWTFTIRDGAIERVCMNQERQEALEAAGLREPADERRSP